MFTKLFLFSFQRIFRKNGVPFRYILRKKDASEKMLLLKFKSNPLLFPGVNLKQYCSVGYTFKITYCISFRKFLSYLKSILEATVFFFDFFPKVINTLWEEISNPVKYILSETFIFPSICREFPVNIAKAIKDFSNFLSA